MGINQLFICSNVQCPEYNIEKTATVKIDDAPICGSCGDLCVAKESNANASN